MTDLVYLGTRKDYDEVKDIIEKKFPKSTTDASDEIHEYRFGVDVPEGKEEEYIRLIIAEGFMECSFSFQVSSMSGRKDPGYQLWLKLTKEVAKIEASKNASANSGGQPGKNPVVQERV